METNAKTDESVGSVQISPKEEGQTEVTDDSMYQAQTAQESGELPDEGETERANTDEQKLQDLLRHMNDESIKLSDFLATESKLINEVCLSVKEILRKLNISLNIAPQNIPLRKKAKKIVLNKESRLIVTNETGEVVSAFLAECPPEIVMAVLWVAIPELVRVMAVYRKKLSRRTSFFEGIKKELRSVAKTITGSKSETPAPCGGQTGVPPKQPQRS